MALLMARPHSTIMALSNRKQTVDGLACEVKQASDLAKDILFSLKQLYKEHQIMYALTATLHTVKTVTVTRKTDGTALQLMPA